MDVSICHVARETYWFQLWPKASKNTIFCEPPLQTLPQRDKHGDELMNSLARSKIIERWR